MAKYYLGFDAGTQSVKVAVYDENMECVASSASPTTITYPKPGWVDMDADEYLALTIHGMKECSKQMLEKNLDPKDIKVIMGDGIICGIVGVDVDGNAITPYIPYLDSRTQEDAALINSWNLDIWAKETGNPEADCLYPALYARWILKNNENFKEKGVKLVHNGPYVLSHLAGLKAEDMFIDYGAMSGWGLGYKVEEKCWSKEQLDILEIPESVMPKIVKAWDIIGYLTEEIANDTGLQAGIPVCGGAGDTMQSMLGSGVIEVNQAADVAGTCAMFCVATKGIIPELSKKGMGLMCNSGTLPDTYFYWGGIRTGGMALRWYKDAVCKKETDGSYYDILNEGAAEVPAGSNGVIFLPYLTGGTMEAPDATGCFLNMTLDTDQTVLWRAVLEAIGFDYMDVVDTYRSAGVELSKITITEGGSRSEIWNQIKADMLGSDVVTLKNAGGAVVTNCLVGAYAIGDIENITEALKKTQEVKRLYHTNPEVHDFYAKQCESQKKIVDSMKDTFRLVRDMNN